VIENINMELIHNIHWLTAAVIMTAIGLCLTIFKYLFDKRYEKSLFYLEYIKKTFEDAVELIKHGKNNHVNWHAMVDRLKSAQQFLGKLKKKAHREIYEQHCLYAFYRIGYIINKIDSSKFFYGIYPYEQKSKKELYDKITKLSSLNITNSTLISEKDDHNPWFLHNISVTSLSYLLNFMDIVEKIDCFNKKTFDSRTRYIPHLFRWYYKRLKYYGKGNKDKKTTVQLVDYYCVKYRTIAIYLHDIDVLRKENLHIKQFLVTDNNLHRFTDKLNTNKVTS